MAAFELQKASRANKQFDGRDSKFLKEIRENFDYDARMWREIRDEAKQDMRYVAGDPWDPRERQERINAGRPCLALDELNQYINQTVNDVRLNKRAIKLVPESEGATDKTAEWRGNLIRQIEYKSNAQAAYCTGYQGAVERSYGYWRISTQYCHPDSFDQELCIKRIQNPDTVYLDWDAKEADYSDMGHAFLIDQYRPEAFRKRWPEAEITDFSSDIITEAPNWITDERVQVAEYWRVEHRKRTLLLLDDSATGQKIFLDEAGPGAKIDGSFLVFPDGVIRNIANRRECEDPSVVQYLTNGIEILEKNPWPGRWVPIVICTGKEIYVDDGGGSKRKLVSLIRLARDPYMLYCYYRTCQAELVGMTPKTPFIGYEGQFENHEEEWKNVNKWPQAYLQVKPLLDATGQNVLPLPQRQPFIPAVEPLELGAESAKRAIQSAMGMYNTSVGRQDTKATSGVAIKALDTQSSQGSYHFIDSYDMAIRHTGRILDDLLPYYYDNARDVGIRKPDETHEVIRINEPRVNPATGQQEKYDVNEGDHGVTVTVGPSYQSQREQASDFVDTLVANLATLPLMPPQKAEILSLSIKLKQLGPLGDQMADIISPNQADIPPQVQAAMAQRDAENQMLKQTVQGLLQERQAKILEIQSKLQIASLQETTKLTVAEMKVQFEASQAMLQAELERINGMMSQLHESGLQQSQQQHEATQAERAAQQAIEQQKVAGPTEGAAE